jgi:DNA helicase II / ATP-dependent DNA helicase PcrA
MSSNFTSRLNEMQAEAVKQTDGPLLIIAGAGSGKTRVITFRIAHLLSRGVPQSQILAVTFTNKAAKEMALRIKEIMRGKLQRLTISTFHAFGAQVLREHPVEVGLRPGFSIYDTQDQASLLKETARELGLARDTFDLVAAAAVVSSVKTRRTPWSGQNEWARKLYEEYHHNLRLFNAVDFDDLMMLPLELLDRDFDIRTAYQERYRYLLVDEFQDTSAVQYDFLRLLVGEAQNVCVVGDDDQSIYSWRGASFENIRRFERDFPRVREIKLEQNYRSTRTILRAANALIARNTQRKAKVLWSGLPEGSPIEIYHAETEIDEAEFIASHIRTLMIRESFRYHDFGILLRANHLTRALEEVLRRETIPYVVSGGMSFFERQEVRDILAYLKLIANHDDDTSLLRIVNTPRRGIGRKMIERAAAHAAEAHCSLFSALAALGAPSAAAAAAAHGEEKSRAAAAEFVDTISAFRQKLMVRKGMSTGLRELVEDIDYWGHLLTENKDAKDKDVVKWKFGNVESLIGSIADFEEDPDVADPNLYDYLARVTLASRDDLDSKDEGARVNMMTIHAAKGLEFPVVFLAGVEQDIIPHSRAVEEGAGNVEEERRLFYVALTRAQKHLYLSHCASRRRMGKPVDSFPSPFLDELPSDCISSPQEAKDFVPDFGSAWKKIAGEEKPGA